MKFFIDSADPKQVKKSWDTGLIDGVTTNPTLATRAGVDFKQAAHEILEIVDGPVSLEVISTDYDGILREGRELAKIHENVVVKVPMLKEGLKAAKVLVQEGIKVNITLVFSPAQSLLVGKIGAAYVSPFVGRLHDISQDGMDLIAQTRQIYDNYGFDTEILVASDRTPMDTVNSALVGADVITLKAENFDKLFKHPLTDNGLERFLKDWEEAGQDPLV
jgi:transaldolase